MRHLIDQQGAYAPPRPLLTGRHKAPTGVPARTQVRVGGEGTTSGGAVTHPGGAQWIATAQLPNGLCKRFADIPGFDAYVAVWRAAGFQLAWQSPRNVLITWGGLRAGPPRPDHLPAPSFRSYLIPGSSRHGETRSAHCQARLVRAALAFGQHRSVFVSHRSRGRVSVHQARSVCFALAVGQGMSQKPAQAPFAWWSGQGSRPARPAPTGPTAALHRRPFARTAAEPIARGPSALPTAEIFPFTGSNTPYESHE